MIDPKYFFNALKNEGIENFCGVPDSLLKDICAYISDNTEDCNHMITANEGSAIALAAGQYISSGRPSLVYMQNSGFGNAVNPLLSLADKDVYSIPMLVMIGWRGEPGVKDEPQHVKQGFIMESLLQSCDLNYYIIDDKSHDIDLIINAAVKRSLSECAPVILLVRKNTFAKYRLKEAQSNLSNLTREEAIKAVIGSSSKDDIIVSTTGMASRELYEIRISNKQPHSNDFLTVGSMGHASMIALGIAQRTTKNVYCIDGDGSAIMHLGNMSSVGQSNRNNYIHILLNNAAHDSVGGQPTLAGKIDLSEVASACGYKSVKTVNNAKDIELNINNFFNLDGPHLLQVKICKGSRSDLGRPKSSPAENKKLLMSTIKN